MSSSQRVPIDKINRDMLLQPRAELHKDWIQDYAEDMLAGAKFPPVIVYFDGQQYWLADGFHRLYAAETTGMKQVRAEVRGGSRREALLYSLSANAEHGHRRTGEDKRRAVDIVLGDAEWSALSDRKIADICGVTHPFVAGRRRRANGTPETETAGNDYQQPQRPNDMPPADTEPLPGLVVEAADAPKAETFDWEAARLRSSAMEAIRALAALPTVDDVIAAWGKSNSYGEPMETLEKAADWLTRFLYRYRTFEPERWARVQAAAASQSGNTANAEAAD